MAEIELNPPSRFIQGSTVKWRSKHADYDPSTWTLTVALVTESDKQEVTATDYGDGSFLITIDDSVSAEFLPGLYRFQEMVSNGSERHQIGYGVIEVVHDYAAVVSGHDGRSPAAVIYDAITAVMQGKATSDQSSMAIGGRSLSRYSWDELMQARGSFAHEMHDDERMARGFMPNKPKTIRFTR